MGIRGTIWIHNDFLWYLKTRIVNEFNFVWLESTIYNEFSEKRKVHIWFIEGSSKVHRRFIEGFSRFTEGSWRAEVLWKLPKSEIKANNKVASIETNFQVHPFFSIERSVKFPNQGWRNAYMNLGLHTRWCYTAQPVRLRHLSGAENWWPGDFWSKFSIRHLSLRVFWSCSGPPTGSPFEMQC